MYMTENIILFILNHVMLRISMAYAVMWCPSVHPSVTFVYSVKKNKHIVTIG